MAETLPSPLEYFSDEEVPFGNSPDTFVYIKFDFDAMKFALNVKQNGDDEYIGGDGDDWEEANEDSVQSFVVEVCEEYGAKNFPASIWQKAITFITHRQYTESFNVPVTKPSIFKAKTKQDNIKALYFKPLPGVFSGYLRAERGGVSFAGPLEDREMLTGAVNVLNEALQDATEMDATAKVFCLLAEVGRQLPGGEINYAWGGLLIPYAHPRQRMVEELLVPGDGEIRRLNLPRVPDRRSNPIT